MKEGLMNKGWMKQRLVSITEKITDGSHNPPKGVTESDYMMLSSKNVFDDNFHYDGPRYLTAEQFQQEHKRTGIIPGDVLLTIVGTVGRCAVVPTNAPKITLQRSVAVIRPISKFILPRFLMYSFIQRNEELNAQARGVAQKGIYLETLRDMEVMLPPQPEQLRIVAILDGAFEGIATAKANAEKNLKNARQLFESHLNSVFSQRGEGWVEKTLGDTAKVKGGKRVPKGYQLSTNQTDFPYIRVTDFTDTGSIDMGDLRYISADVHNKIKNYVIYSEDLYISIAGTIGKTGIIPDELNGSNLTENACRLAFKPGLSNRFVYYFTLTSSFIEQAGVNTRTAAQPKLALSRLSTIKLGVPSVQAQQRLVDDFDALCEETQRLESIYQKKIDALDALKKSILQKAFSGEL